MRRRALSLLEVLIAMGIVAVGLLTMVGVYLSGIQLMARGEQITLSSEVGRRFLEQVKAAGFDTIPNGNSHFDGRTNDPLQGTFPPVPYPAEGPYRLEVLTEQPETKLKAVTVRVFYDGPSHVMLQTYFRP